MQRSAFRSAIESLRLYSPSGWVSGSTLTVIDSATAGRLPAAQLAAVGQRFPSQSGGVGEVPLFGGHPLAGAVM